MIKYNGQDLADIKYNGASIKRVMQNGVQIWPVDSGVPNIPTGIQLSEYEIEEPQFDADYQAVLDQATGQGYTLPSSAQQDDQNQLLLDLKICGVWDKLDLFYLFANDIVETDHRFANINWVSPSLYGITLATTPNVWFNNDGFEGEYNNCNFIASLDAVNYTLDNGSMGFKTFTNVIDDALDVGWNKSGESSLLAPGRNLFRINNTGGSLASAPSTTDGFWIASRQDSSILDIFKDGLLFESLVSARDQVLSTVNCTISGVYRSSYINPSTKRFNLFFLSSGLSSSEVADFNTAIDNYLIAINTLISSAQVDALLIEADSNGDSNTVIDISLYSQPRTSESDTAVANLISRGNTVITS